MLWKRVFALFCVVFCFYFVVDFCFVNNRLKKKSSVDIEITNQSAPKITLLEVLNDKTGINEFAKFLISEFCIENLLFVIAVSQFKKEVLNAISVASGSSNGGHSTDNNTNSHSNSEADSNGSGVSDLDTNTNTNNNNNNGNSNGNNNDKNGRRKHMIQVSFSMEDPSSVLQLGIGQVFNYSSRTAAITALSSSIASPVEDNNNHNNTNVHGNTNINTGNSNLNNDNEIGNPNVAMAKAASSDSIISSTSNINVVSNNINDQLGDDNDQELDRMESKSNTNFSALAAMAITMNSNISTMSDIGSPGSANSPNSASAASNDDGGGKFTNTKIGSIDEDTTLGSGSGLTSGSGSQDAVIKPSSQDVNGIDSKYMYHHLRTLSLPENSGSDANLNTDMNFGIMTHIGTVRSSSSTNFNALGLAATTTTTGNYKPSLTRGMSLGTALTTSTSNTNNNTSNNTQNPGNIGALRLGAQPIPSTEVDESTAEQPPDQPVLRVDYSDGTNIANSTDNFHYNPNSSNTTNTNNFNKSTKHKAQHSRNDSLWSQNLNRPSLSLHNSLSLNINSNVYGNNNSSNNNNNNNSKYPPGYLQKSVANGLRAHSLSRSALSSVSPFHRRTNSRRSSTYSRIHDIKISKNVPTIDIIKNNPNDYAKQMMLIYEKYIDKSSNLMVNISSQVAKDVRNEIKTICQEALAAEYKDKQDRKEKEKDKEKEKEIDNVSTGSSKSSNHNQNVLPPMGILTGSSNASPTADNYGMVKQDILENGININMTETEKLYKFYNVFDQSLMEIYQLLISIFVRFKSSSEYYNIANVVHHRLHRKKSKNSGSRMFMR